MSFEINEILELIKKKLAQAEKNLKLIKKIKPNHGKQIFLQ